MDELYEIIQSDISKNLDSPSQELEIYINNEELDTVLTSPDYFKIEILANSLYVKNLKILFEKRYKRIWNK